MIVENVKNLGGDVVDVVKNKVEDVKEGVEKKGE